MNFDERMKLRAESEDCPLPDGFRERLEEKVNELIKEGRPVKKRIFKTTLLAAALCAVLTAAAIAVAPTLWEAVAGQLGSFAPYSKAVEGVSIRDQGIELRVVSALSDGNVIRIFYEIQDLTGDRLGEDMYLELDVDYPDGFPWEQTSYTSDGGKLIRYDPEERTALMEFALRGDGRAVDGTSIQLRLNKIYSHYQRFSVPFPQDVSLNGEALESLELEGDRVVLLPGQTRRELETGLVSLSSAGIGSDNMLHFLYEVYDETLYAADSRIRTWFFSRLDQKALEEENRLWNSRLTRYNAGRKEPVFFQWEGRFYCDEAYPVGAEDVEDVIFKHEKDVSGQLYTGTVTVGEWVVDVPIAAAPSREIDLQSAIPQREAEATDNAVELRTKSLRLTALGANLELTVPGLEMWTVGSSYSPRYDVSLTLYLADGSTVEVGRDDGIHLGRDYETFHWTFPEAIDPEKVTAVALDSWYIPLSGGSAQPGYPLPEAPAGEK